MLKHIPVVPITGLAYAGLECDSCEDGRKEYRRAEQWQRTESSNTFYRKLYLPVCFFFFFETEFQFITASKILEAPPHHL